VWDAQFLPFRDNAFDSALCIAVLEHLEAPERGIKEVNRVLKNAGYSIFQVPVLNMPFPILVPLFRRIIGVRCDKCDHKHVFSTKILINLLNKNNFEVVKIFHGGFTTIFMRIGRLRRTLESLDVYIAALCKKISLLRFFASHVWIIAKKRSPR